MVEILKSMTFLYLCHLSTFEKIEKLSYARKGMFFLVKNFNKQKQEYAMKKDLKCDPCDKVYVNQQL